MTGVTAPESPVGTAPLRAITVIGHDRPGIIADTTAGLAELGLNIEDSTMTRLRGHFAMTLVCRGTAPSSAISAQLDALTADGTLSVTVADVDETAETDGEVESGSWVVTVHGGDRPGIVSAVASELAAASGNITDLTTRLAGDLYLVVAEVDLPSTADTDALAAKLSSVAQGLGVTATLRPLETDEL